MIIVTGAAGFIGSNIIQGLNKQGITDIIAVDDLTDGRKYQNLLNTTFSDYIDYQTFLAGIKKNDGRFKQVVAIYHQGACTDTMEWDGRYLLENNYEYSKFLFNFALAHKIPFLYASSGAIYGDSDNCTLDTHNERPLNVYGYSKLLFDNYVRKHLSSAKSQIVGLRYFNVYGPGESHKGPMKSLIRHLYDELLEKNTVTLFTTDKYPNGEQRRDFIYIDDVVAINLWFLKNQTQSGIFNAGTGEAPSFKEIAEALISYYGQGELCFKPMPENLKGRYQFYTCAELSSLRQVGFNQAFTPLTQGIKAYLSILQAANSKTVS